MLRFFFALKLYFNFFLFYKLAQLYFYLFIAQEIFFSVYINIQICSLQYDLKIHILTLFFSYKYDYFGYNFFSASITWNVSKSPFKLFLFYNFSFNGGHVIRVLYIIPLSYWRILINFIQWQFCENCLCWSDSDGVSDKKQGNTTRFKIVEKN